MKWRSMGDLEKEDGNPRIGDLGLRAQGLRTEGLQLKV